MIRIYLLTYLLTLTSFTLFGQSKDTWTLFWNKDSSLIGFKDNKGIVKIKPKFKRCANKFDDIIAVWEKKKKAWESYYLTKQGRTVGKGKVYFFDNGADCESEGFIRYRDDATHKVGLLDKNGAIAIPAEYNDLTSVRNGMIVALKDAYWDEKRRSEIFEFPWVGGKEVLINTKNEMLIDNFSFSNDINFYSLLISATPNTDTIRQSLKTVKGQYYSFINFDREFKAWLKSSLLNNFTKEKLLNATYNYVTFSAKQKGWTSEAKAGFINRNFELIKTKLLQLNSKDCQYSIMDDELTPYINESDKTETYFDNCGELKHWINPVEEVTINYKDEKDWLQDDFAFLRTGKGYKLIGVTVRKGELK